MVWKVWMRLQAVEVILADIDAAIVDHLTIVDEVGDTPGIVLRSVNAKAFLQRDEHVDIQQADIELKFTSREAADSYVASVGFLKQHLFLTYLQSQCF